MSGYDHWSGSTPDLWDDLRFPATAFNPPGLASDPDIEATSGLFLFDSASTEFLYILAQMPHGWREGSAVVPHVHWTPTTTGTGNVLWRLDYQIRKPVGDVAFDFVSGWSTVDKLAAGNGVAHKAQVDSFGDLDMTGFTLSTLIAMRMGRIGGDASDTYDGADARLLEFDLHYQKDSEGSRQQFEK